MSCRMRGAHYTDCRLIMSSLQDYVKMARIAELAERFDDMKDYIFHVATTLPEGASSIHLTAEERNLFSVAYKALLSPKRSAWRNLVSLSQKEQERHDNTGFTDCLEEAKKGLEEEMLSLCSEVIDVVNKYLLVETDANSESIDDSMYYLKLEGDYYRYEAEFLEGEARSDAVKHAQEKYEQALKVSDANEVSSVNSTLLSLYLNYSVFLYEITDQKELAIKLASKAFDDAIKILDTIPEKDYKESTLILQLLQDNLRLWSSEKEKSLSPVFNKHAIHRHQTGRQTDLIWASFPPSRACQRAGHASPASQHPTRCGSACT